MPDRVPLELCGESLQAPAPSVKAAQLGRARLQQHSPLLRSHATCPTVVVGHGLDTLRDIGQRFRQIPEIDVMAHRAVE